MVRRTQVARRSSSKGMEFEMEFRLVCWVKGAWHDTPTFMFDECDRV